MSHHAQGPGAETGMRRGLAQNGGPKRKPPSSAAPEAVSGEPVQKCHCPKGWESKGAPRSASPETRPANATTAVGCAGRKEYMPLEPDIVDRAKVALSHATAALAGGVGLYHIASATWERDLASPAVRAVISTVGVFIFFVVLALSAVCQGGFVASVGFRAVHDAGFGALASGVQTVMPPSGPSASSAWP